MVVITKVTEIEQPAGWKLAGDVERLKVPGGWLYRSFPDRAQIVYVPDPEVWVRK